ncbi:unnamed protein product [Mesocestoides corti]|uniref:Myomegalin n=1 Tax=Mesocestoides corti TaxID=53468 RepID=A0A0R3U399_MESCO|nr:unnamed protein product [Mesocestoides corti]
MKLSSRPLFCVFPIVSADVQTTSHSELGKTAPSSDANSPVTARSRKTGMKTSTSLHQELNDSLSNMRTVEQQLQYMEHILFGGERSKSTETDYLQELERINNELRGFVPISGDRETGGAGTSISHITPEATDSGVEGSIATRGEVAGEVPNGGTTSHGDAFPNGDFY